MIWAWIFFSKIYEIEKIGKNHKPWDSYLSANLLSLRSLFKSEQRIRWSYSLSARRFSKWNRW